MTTLFIIAVVFAQILDLATTIYLMPNPRMEEKNPLLRGSDGKLIVWRGVALKSVLVLAIGYLLMQGFGTTLDVLITAVCVVPTLYVSIRNLRRCN